MWKLSNLAATLALTSALLLSRSCAAPPALTIQEVEAPSPDEETMDYLIPRLAAKYGSESAWRGVMDPRLYVLTELESSQDSAPSLEPSRPKRKLPSLSIVNPMEVLRQRLLLEIARKQMRENVQRQAEENRIFLQNVGKRASADRYRNFDGILSDFQRPGKLSSFFSNQKQDLTDDQANETA